MKTVFHLTLFALMLAGMVTFADERPNIVLIMADDMGYECLGVNGSLDYSTPRLDQMAARGLRFEHCYSQPICTPSRVKLMTGLSNKRNYIKFGMLDRNQTTFAQLLRKAGYATCIAGKWQLGREPDAPQHFGFDESLLWQHTRARTDAQQRDTRYPNPRLERNGKHVDYDAGQFSTDLFVEFIEEFIRNHREEPFLVYYPMALVHCPFCPTPASRDWDARDRGSSTYKGQPEYFGEMVAYADSAVGKLVDCLTAQGIRENTVVLFIGDNGTDTPIATKTSYGTVVGAKGQTIDGGNRVPCIIEWPAAMKVQGTVSQNVIDFSDFLPTICEVAHAPLPEGVTLDGQSFLPQLLSQAGSPRHSIFQWYSRNGVPEQAIEFARNQRYKLYATGEFFDVPNDRTEQRPLTELTAEQEAIRVELQKHINAFQDVVPPQARR